MTINKVRDSQNPDQQSIERAKEFVREFRKRLVETKTDKTLIRHINQHL